MEKKMENLKVRKNDDSLLILAEHEYVTRAYYLQKVSTLSGVFSRINMFNKYNIKDDDVDKWLERLESFKAPGNFHNRLSSTEPINSISTYFYPIYYDSGNDGSLVIYRERYNGFLLARAYTTSPLSIETLDNDSYYLDTYPSEGQNIHYIIYTGDKRESLSMIMNGKEKKYNISSILKNYLDNVTDDGIYYTEHFVFDSGVEVSIKVDNTNYSRHYQISTPVKTYFGSYVVNFGGKYSDVKAMQYITTLKLGELVRYDLSYNVSPSLADYKIATYMELSNIDFYNIHTYEYMYGNRYYFADTNYGPLAILVTTDKRTKYDSVFIFNNLISHIMRKDILLGKTPFHLKVAEDLYNSYEHNKEGILKAYKIYKDFKA